MFHLLRVSDLSKEEIESIFVKSLELDRAWSIADLAWKNILFVFEKPSLRTRVATEVAINSLGANVICVDPSNFFWREEMKDVMNNVSSWCDGVFARVFSHGSLEEMKWFSQIPIVNALSDTHHPMQALADLLTIWWKFWRDKKIVCSFVGDANNVTFSLFEILLLFGHEVRLVCPEKYCFSQDDLDYFWVLASENWWKFDVFHDVNEWVVNADIIYTDTFISMWEEDTADEKIKFFTDYQVNEDVIYHTGKKSYFMHCLPAHRGEEVTNEVIDSEVSLVYEQARNRMVVSKWVFHKLLSSF